MMMNDKPLTRNYDSDKEKSEIDSDIRVLKIILDSDLQHISAEEIAFYNKFKPSVNESLGSLTLWHECLFFSRWTETTDRDQDSNYQPSVYRSNCMFSF